MIQTYLIAILIGFGLYMFGLIDHTVYIGLWGVGTAWFLYSLTQNQRSSQLHEQQSGAQSSQPSQPSRTS
jgi:hypothetical protein